MSVMTFISCRESKVLGVIALISELPSFVNIVAQKLFNKKKLFKSFDAIHLQIILARGVVV